MSGGKKGTVTILKEGNFNHKKCNKLIDIFGFIWYKKGIRSKKFLSFFVQKPCRVKTDRVCKGSTDKEETKKLTFTQT